MFLRAITTLWEGGFPYYYMVTFEDQQPNRPEECQESIVLKEETLPQTIRCIRNHTFAVYTCVGKVVYGLYKIKEVAFSLFGKSEWDITRNLLADKLKDLDKLSSINNDPLQEKDYLLAADSLLHTYSRIYQEIRKKENVESAPFLQKNCNNTVVEKMKKIWNVNLEETKAKLKEQNGISLNVSIE